MSTCLPSAEERALIVALDHVQLAMPAGGEAEACAFYSGLLGLPEVAKPASLRDRGGCWFERGPVKVHLGMEAAFQPAHKAHPAFSVDDLPAVVARLEAAGVTIIPDNSDVLHQRIFIADPFGNRIELLQVD